MWIVNFSRLATRRTSGEEEILASKSICRSVNETAPAGRVGRRERMLQAIGEPKMVDTQRPAPVAHLCQQGHQHLPGLRRLYGMEESIENITVSYFRHAAQGWRKEADPYLLGSGGRRQELDCREAQEPIEKSLLRHQGLAW